MVKNRLWQFLFGSIPAANDWGAKEAPNKSCLKPLKNCDAEIEDADEKRYERMDEDIEKLRDTREKLKKYRLSKSNAPPPPISAEPDAPA